MVSLNFALVGCGRIAKRHSELLGLGQISNARLAAVCDVNEERASNIGTKMGVPYYTDMHQMMKAESIDVVVVLTDSGLHADHVVALCSLWETHCCRKTNGFDTCRCGQNDYGLRSGGNKVFCNQTKPIQCAGGKASKHLIPVV